MTIDYFDVFISLIIELVNFARTYLPVQHIRAVDETVKVKHSPGHHAKRGGMVPRTLSRSECVDRTVLFRNTVLRMLNRDASGISSCFECFLFEYTYKNSIILGIGFIVAF